MLVVNRVLKVVARWSLHKPRIKLLWMLEPLFPLHSKLSNLQSKRLLRNWSVSPLLMSSASLHLLESYVFIFNSLVKKVEEGKVSPIKEVTPPQIPEDLSSAIKSGKVRAPTHIISTISDDRGTVMDTKPYCFTRLICLFKLLF